MLIQTPQNYGDVHDTAIIAGWFGTKIAPPAFFAIPATVDDSWGKPSLIK